MSVSVIDIYKTDNSDSEFWLDDFCSQPFKIGNV